MLDNTHRPRTASNRNVELPSCSHSTARPSGPTATASRASSTTSATPTRQVSRRRSALGELEGGEALLFPSGPRRSLRSSSPSSAPGRRRAGRRRVLRHGRLFGSLERWGLRFLEFDQTGPPPDAADLVWLEAPSNPFLTMPDSRPPRRTPGGSSSTRRRDARVPAAHSRWRRLRAAQRRRNISADTTTFCSARSSAATEAAARLREFRSRTGSSPRPTRRGCSCAAVRHGDKHCAESRRSGWPPRTGLD